MAQYRYKARSLAGEEKTGVIAAESPQQVAALLRQDGFFLTKVEEEKPKAPFPVGEKAYPEGWPPFPGSSAS